VLKSHGQSLKTSELHDGFALARQTRASQAMPTSIMQARVALLNFNLRQHRMQLGVQIQVTDPEELDKIRQKYSAVPLFCFKKFVNFFILLLS
jgi:T-complex protein 1 subunit alpha